MQRMSGKRQIEDDRRRKKSVGGDEEAEGGERGMRVVSLFLSLSLSFASLSIAFFLSEIDQRPRETD